MGHGGVLRCSRRTVIRRREEMGLKKRDWSNLTDQDMTEARHAPPLHTCHVSLCVDCSSVYRKY